MSGISSKWPELTSLSLKTNLSLKNFSVLSIHIYCLRFSTISIHFYRVATRNQLQQSKSPGGVCACSVCTSN